MKNLFTIVVLIGIAWFAYQRYQSHAPDLAVQPDESDEIESRRERDRILNEARNFRCDGRQHCSQMSSCEEAKFFIQNCPNTKMDGDNDGVPCESQWCD